MADNKNGAAGASQATITKMDAVRRALKKMGRNAKPTEMQPYIKTTFGIEMTTDHISTCKGDILRKSKAKKAAAKASAGPKEQAVPAQRPAAGSILLDDVLTAKALLERVGAQQLRTLIDGLAGKG